MRHRDMTDISAGPGLYIECEDQQLRLRRVSPHLTGYIADGFKSWHELCAAGIARFTLKRSVTEMHQSKDSPQSNPVQANGTIPQCPFASPRTTSTPARQSETKCAIKDDLTQIIVQRNEIHGDPIPVEPIPAEAPSQPPSRTESASKCPIRFLDQHSPEEVAEYFKNHRHEIPRSHEICVKRYQKNEDQIRQLDHKYGSLVNMIQGLGQKHQPMLHTKDEEHMSQARTSQDKVEAWNKGIDHGHTRTKVEDGAGDNTSSVERHGHFERHLKEIRIGESPSRPWGISVPQGAHIPPSAASSHEEQAGVDISNEAEPPTPATAPDQGATRSPSKSRESRDSHPNMLFTGPVFIGYTPDQITDLLQRTGLAKGSG